MKSKVDQINDAFIEILAKQNAKQYGDYIKSINREMIDNVENLTADKVKSIVSSHKLDIDDIVLMFLIQNALLLIVGKRLTKKEKIPLLPIIALTALYSIKKPKQFAKRVTRVIKGVGLNPNEQKALTEINKFKKDNVNVLKRAKRIAIERTETSIVKSKRNKRMLRDFKRFEQQGDSIKKIENKLVRKYNKVVNVERVLRTELHSQSELVRQIHSEAIGFTHKTWKTQSDSRVRDTHFHEGVTNKRIPIESDFRAGGLRAQHPGDDKLPPSDRINCRCYLIYD